MRHFSEEDLIAYQLHEATNEGEIRRHLEECVVCASMSDSIAETLRVFSAEPVPTPDVERNWQRLRRNLTVLEPAPRRRLGFLSAGWMWGSVGLVAAALLVVVSLFGVHVRRQDAPKPNYAINGRGPLTTRPADPAIANHLDAAERLLTEVNHASGPLDDTMRSQAHDLLLKNAVYVRTAHDQGDVAEAAVLDNLGRVLTTIDHTSDPENEHRTLRLRIEMNTDGLLLDLRILRQNGQGQ